MTALAVVVRLVHLAAGIQLLGVFLFLVLVARPAWRRAGPELEAAAHGFERTLLRLGAWAAAVALLSGLAALALQAASVTGSRAAAFTPSVWVALLSGTQSGLVWMIRMAAFALLGGFLLLREREQDWRDWWALRLEGVLLAAVAAAALAWAGHATTAEDWGIWPLVGDALHLLATGAWLGGLGPLALLLTWTLREPAESARGVAREAARRFSALGLGAVTLLLLTGTLNAAAQIRGVPPLVGTPYGRLLLGKLALLVPLLAIAAVNLRRLKPRLLLATDPEALRRDLARLRRNVLLEATLGLGILALVAALGVTPPGRHVAPSWPVPFRFAWEVTKDLPGVRTR
ncbi:MAG: CopD family protein, partial [Candidatus Rokubacteria bacterium]|nr:CopD family protein [Candidatus Rokubacteria bacterium]